MIGHGFTFRIHHQIGENNSESAGVMRDGTQGRSPFAFSSSLRYYLPTARLLAARICRKSAMCGMKFGNARGRVFVSAQRYGQSYKSPDSLAERRSGSGDPFAQLTCTAQSDSRKFAFALCTSGVAPPSHRITTCSYHKCYKI